MKKTILFSTLCIGLAVALNACNDPQPTKKTDETSTKAIDKIDTEAEAEIDALLDVIDL